MNQTQARQLAERIEKEDNRIKANVQQEAVVGKSFWVVAVYASTSNTFLGNMEEPTDWEILKQNLLDHR